MRGQVRSTNPLRTTLLATTAVAALVLALPGAGSYAAWNDSLPLGGTATTGSLSIDEDTLTAGAWTKDGAAFDPADGTLAAGTTLTSTVSDVPVTAVGDNLKATFALTGAQLPDSVKEHVDVAVTSSPVLGAESGPDGHQTVDLVLTVTADADLPDDAQKVDLSHLTVTLSNGHGWSDTATLDAGTLTTAAGSDEPEGGVLELGVSLDEAGTDDLELFLSGTGEDTIIDWGDGTQSDALDGVNRHAYANQAYTVRVIGTFKGIGSEEQLTDVDALEPLRWVLHWDEGTGTTDASYAFANAVNLMNTVAPPSTITDTSYMFYGATSLASIGTWDTSHVTTMAHMFDGATSYGAQDVGGWDTSNVEDMSFTFRDTLIKETWMQNWDTSNVTTMEGMFSNASGFLGNGLSTWDTSHVAVFRQMFQGAEAFNQDIGVWNTSSGTGFSKMFQDATSFNRMIGEWNTSRAQNTSEMFRGASSFNQDISRWDTGNVTTMEAMFRDATAFSQDLSRWDVAEVHNHNDFSEGSALTADQLPPWARADSRRATTPTASPQEVTDSARRASSADEGPTVDATPPTPEAAASTPDTAAEPPASVADADADEPAEPVDPDQAVEDLEQAWRHARASDTGAARQAIEDAARVVDEALGDGSADEIVRRLEDEAARTDDSTHGEATPSATPTPASPAPTSMRQEES